MRGIVLSVFLAGVLLFAGCGSDIDYATQDRLDHGLVIILPGIEGESALNHDVRDGLVAAGVDKALPIYSWGRPVPIAGPLLNQMDVIGNRLAAARIASMIVQYQDSHPGRPVYLIGHSGGGGVAVFAAEALPAGRQVDGIVLLSASISSAYDMTKAIRKCRRGAANFYFKRDIGFLIIGTIVAGNVDGTHGPSAGAIGFDLAGRQDAEEKRVAYARLFQVELTDEMTGGDGSAHAAATRSSFVARYVSPWVSDRAWPAHPAVPAINYTDLSLDATDANHLALLSGR